MRVWLTTVRPGSKHFDAMEELRSIFSTIQEQPNVSAQPRALTLARGGRVQRVLARVMFLRFESQSVAECILLTAG
jgi:hypothetical protein